MGRNEQKEGRKKTKDVESYKRLAQLKNLT
jgi:hypothetical protein